MDSVKNFINSDDDDAYIGMLLSNYKIIEKKGNGKIGTVYKAVREDFSHTVACKIIPEGKLKKGWDRELLKVVKLHDIDSVIQYFNHGSALDKNKRPFTYIFWNFIDGYNLKEYKEKFPNAINLSFIEKLADTIIRALFACKNEGINHGDLHEGNILISKPDPRTIENTTRIYVADFGYGGSHNDIQPKDDIKQFVSIIQNLLSTLNKTELNALDKILIDEYRNFFSKKFSEIDPTEGRFVGDLRALYLEFKELRRLAELKSSKGVGNNDEITPGDYLWAEAIGLRKEEWKHLFVPEILGVEELLSQNNCVLTGARGCGKTMAFRRLTVFMDKVIGEPSGVPGSDSFLGFYVNCRDLIEAFPYIPFNIKDEIAAQIIHYFHLTWLNEIIKTISLFDGNDDNNYDWLNNFFIKIFGDEYPILPKGSDILGNAGSFIEIQKESCRISELGRRKTNFWKLSNLDFLDRLTSEIKQNLNWAASKPFYFFLDDYTIPIVPRNIQKVINQIIFKRRDQLFFKISSESELSFVKSTAKGKPLELIHDYALIDMANISLYQTEEDKQELLEKIFKPRIDRNLLLKSKNISLVTFLGKSSPNDNNALATLLRQKAQGLYKKKIFYHGIKHFVGMWSSDTRIMIQMFVDILRESESKIKEGATNIEPEIQDRVFRTNGGEFLNFTESVPNPAFLEKQQPLKIKISYGKHLRDIVEAFLQVSKYDLCHANLNGNTTNEKKYLNPKQAFRIEILDKIDLPEDAMNYYEGLIRWHIFFHDYRGKSIRSQINPRLFLHRILIPHGQITFSSRDHIHLQNKELIMLLLDPKKFTEYWIKKRRVEKRGPHTNLELF